MCVQHSHERHISRVGRSRGWRTSTHVECSCGWCISTRVERSVRQHSVLRSSRSGSRLPATSWTAAAFRLRPRPAGGSVPRDRPAAPAAQRQEGPCENGDLPVPKRRTRTWEVRWARRVCACLCLACLQTPPTRSCARRSACERLPATALRSCRVFHLGGCVVCLLPLCSALFNKLTFRGLCCQFSLGWRVLMEVPLLGEGGEDGSRAEPPGVCRREAQLPKKSIVQCPRE